jgi:hypothetical protein
MAMTNIHSKLTAEYWQAFSITKHDIEFLENHLFENEIPLSSPELVTVLIGERIRVEREAQAAQQKNSGTIYLPKEQYKKNEKLVFPALGFAAGQVISIRPGNNPQLGAFEVLEVRLADGATRFFASCLGEHKLNDPVEEKGDPESDVQAIRAEHGEQLEQKLWDALASDKNIAQVAGRWFPRALLMDINPGHLNLAEAVVEMAGGEPLSASSLMEQIDLASDANTKLTEFSLNYALQEDGRFDEVGPAGQVLWCLRRLEPEQVQHVPVFLQYKPVAYDRSLLSEQMLALEAQLDDELSDADQKPAKTNEATLTLTYPHWRAGTLPVSARVRSFFPTANYAPRIRFTLVDGKTGEKIPAWVVREHGYVYGLRNWYEKQKLIPGASITVRHSNVPGEVIVEAKTRRPVREWVRTVLAGSDGGLVFALLKQEVACQYNERMAVVVPELDAVDKSFAQMSKNNQPLEKLVRDMLRELSKLTPQGHVHAEELYSAVNIQRRVPPAPLFATLAATEDFVHVGDLHFRLGEATTEQE